MLYNEVYKLINDIYLNNHESYTNEIIQFICNDLKIDPLDIQFFCNKYNSIFFYSLTDYINNLKNSKKRNRKLPNDCDRCIALISDKSRCKLAKIKGQSYCGRHSKTIKYGNINNNLDDCYDKIYKLIQAEIKDGSKDYDKDFIRNHIEKLTS